jgi:hypothetical protein
MSKKITALLLCLLFGCRRCSSKIPAGIGSAATPQAILRIITPITLLILQHEQPLADAFRANYTIVGPAMVERAVWYMENGYMVYGHTKYAATGYIDCSNFVSLVIIKIFGYSVTSAARNYNTVGQA